MIDFEKAVAYRKDCALYCSFCDNEIEEDEEYCSLCQRKIHFEEEE